MNRSIFLVSLLLLIGCSDNLPTESGPKIDTQGFDIKQIPGSNVEFAIRLEANNRAIEEGMLLNGTREGIWISYHDSEKLIPKSISNYVNGKLNGAHTTYNNRGGISLLQHFQNDIPEGRTIIFKNGRLVEDALYKAGVLHGVKRIYFDRSDKIQTEVTYKMGVQHGLYKHYNDAGQVVMEYLYENGEKVSGGMVESSKQEEE